MESTSRVDESPEVLVSEEEFVEIRANQLIAEDPTPYIAPPQPPRERPPTQFSKQAPIPTEVLERLTATELRAVGSGRGISISSSSRNRALQEYLEQQAAQFSTPSVEEPE